MDDEELIGLYFGRDEKAIKATADKYGGRLRTLAYRLLLDNGDTDECLNDTWFKVWNAIPPNRPKNLYAFCAAICRRTAINMLEKRTAQQRSAAVVELTAEMEQCIQTVLLLRNSRTDRGKFRYRREQGARYAVQNAEKAEKVH